MKRVSKEQHRAHILLQLLCSRGTDPTFGRVLQELEKTIRRAQKQVAKNRRSDGEDYFDALVEEETAFAETIVGTAFVVAQTYLTGVVSSVESLATALNTPQRMVLPRKRKEILGLCARRIEGAGLPLSIGVEGFANYFKHSEEWSGSWSKLSPKERGTACIIERFGAERGSTGNLRGGLEAMGYSNFAMAKMGRDLELWYEQMQVHCEAVVGKAKL